MRWNCHMFYKDKGGCGPKQDSMSNITSDSAQTQKAKTQGRDTSREGWAMEFVSLANHLPESSLRLPVPTEGASAACHQLGLGGRSASSSVPNKHLPGALKKGPSFLYYRYISDRSQTRQNQGVSWWKFAVVSLSYLHKSRRGLSFPVRGGCLWQTPSSFLMTPFLHMPSDSAVLTKTPDKIQDTQLIRISVKHKYF